jgi:hypothetical protein
MVVDAVVMPYDWDGEANFHSYWPDWIYGGKDLISPVQTTFKPHIIRAWFTPGSAGTADLDIDIDGAGFQSATISVGDSAFNVEQAIEALAYGITADVVGNGTEQSPYQIDLLDPSGRYTVAKDQGGLGGSGSFFFELVQFGRLLPVGWTISQIGNTVLPHGQILEWGASLGVTSDDFPVAVPSGCSAWVWFRGTEFYFPGVQIRKRVVENGYYTAPPVFLHAIGAPAEVRVVMRDNNERLIAAEEITIPADTTIQTTGAWFGPGVISGTQLRIPDATHEIVYRIGHIGTGDPPPIGIACPSLTEGFPQSTIGAIVGDLYGDWTTEHAASTFPLSYWVHGDGGFYLVLDFDDSLDSGGNAWQRTEKITIKRGERFDRVLAKIVRLGYDWRIIPGVVDGYYLLQIFNGGTMGADFSAAKTPTIRPSRDVPRRGIREWIARTGTLVEGMEQNFSLAADASAQAAWGTSFYYEVNLDFDEQSLDAAADVSVADHLRRTRSIVVTIADLDEPTTPVPGVDYLPGDTIRIMDPPDLDDIPERVWQILYAQGEEGLSFEVQLGNNSFAG